ncbi:MAG TPA: hypothetical protein DEF42_13090 [Desulfosporosinus sp.]|nr:hypothetical protein [Desulfosporosinus sp.]
MYWHFRGVVAFFLLVSIWSYDAWAKEIKVLGSGVMGLCRALNFCLGLSFLSERMGSYLWLVLYPFLHTMLITSISKSENKGT